MVTVHQITEFLKNHKWWESDEVWDRHDRCAMWFSEQGEIRIIFKRRSIRIEVSEYNRYTNNDKWERIGGAYYKNLRFVNGKLCGIELKTPQELFS